MKTREKSLTLGICSGGTIRAETTAALVQNIIYLAQHDISTTLVIQIGGYVAVNRNTIADIALTNGTTHLMFIDADMIFPPDGIMKLIEADKPVAGANYNVRLDPTSKILSGPTVQMMVDGRPVALEKGGLPEGLFQCYALATGFMLIDLSVFKKLRTPYFVSKQDKQNNHTTEDIYFCQQLYKKGIEIWCDESIKIGHVGSYVY
jgi:hypothetical protein